MGRASNWALPASMLIATTVSEVHAQTDVVLFKNGDRLTGEIRYLDRGKVTFDNPATGIIRIEWDDIDQLYSEENFEIVVENGERLHGTLAPWRSTELRVQNASGSLDLPLPSVVRITPIEGAFFQRIEMSVDLGYSLAKADDLVQTNAGYDFQYRDELRQFRLNVDASTSDSADDPANARALTKLAFRTFREGRAWDPIGIAQIERNDALGVDLRTTAGGGVSRWLRDSNDGRIAFHGGLVYSREQDFEGVEASTDYEAMAGMDLEWFRYDEPEFDVSTQFTLFRRLSGTEAWRGNADVNVRWELFTDFFWGISVYYTFDAQQSGSDEEETQDYGSFTSLGWKF
jgi:hypothetical protein